jgi:hypothetical protein
MSGGASAVGAVVVGAGVKALVEQLTERLNRRDERRLAAFFDEVAARCRHRGAAETLKLLNDNIDEPWAHRGVKDAVRAIREDLDEAAMPYLALAIALQVEERRYDPRIKRFVAMLSEGDAALIDAVQQVLRVCGRSWGSGWDALEVVVEPQGGGVATRYAGEGKAFLHGEEWLAVMEVLRRFNFLTGALPRSERDPGEVVAALSDLPPGPWTG